MTRTRAFVIMGLITVVADSVFAGAHIVNLEPDTAKRRAIVIYRSKSTETLYLYAPTPWVIGSSHIVAQDTNLWSPLSASPNESCHIYNLINASPGQEYVAVYGNLTQEGTGFGYSPWFRATVPAVDVDWDGYGAPEDEDGEDAREVFCPVTTNNAARRKILIRQPKDDTSLVTPTMTLSWWPTSMRVLKKENNGTLTQLSNGTTINHTPSTVWPVTLYADPTTEASIEILLQGLADENRSRPRDVIEGRSFIEGEVKSVEFTSDHNLLKKNPTSGSEWGDSSDAYETPEWVADTRNNPISQTKNTKLTAKVKLKVEPAGAAFELFGNGFDGYANFRKTGNLSTGSDQEITVTADDVLPNTVGKVNKIIDWKITVGSTEYDIGSSGEHIVYVTYGTPSGSAITEHRVQWCCNTCKGASTLTGISDKIYDALEAEPPKFQLKSPNIPSPLWLLMSDVSWQGQCITLANLMKLEMEMLGGTASIGYVYGSTDTDCFSSSPTAFETRTCSDGEHDAETLVVWSAGGWNNWEAVCKVSNTCYAVKVDKGTAVGILRSWLDGNTTNETYQAWVYFDYGKSEYQPCKTPGPCPVPSP